jgi:hypothetical protein
MDAPSGGPSDRLAAIYHKEFAEMVEAAIGSYKDVPNEPRLVVPR